MRIGFDLDGVLADFNSSFIALIPEVTGRNLFPPDYWPDTWQYPTSVGYTPEEESLVWGRIKDGGVFWRNLPELPDAKVFRDWFYSGAPYGTDYHELYFVTSRMGKHVKLQTEEWCEEHLFPGATVLISSDKGGIAKALKLDYYIDDRAENILDVQAKSPETFAYLLDQPWNRHVDLPRRVIYLSTFLQIIDAHSLAAA